VHTHTHTHKSRHTKHTRTQINFVDELSSLLQLNEVKCYSVLLLYLNERRRAGQLAPPVHKQWASARDRDADAAAFFNNARAEVCAFYYRQRSSLLGWCCIATRVAVVVLLLCCFCFAVCHVLISAVCQFGLLHHKMKESTRHPNFVFRLVSYRHNSVCRVIAAHRRRAK
jgi:hypothetical protein